MTDATALYIIGAIGVPLFLWWVKGSADKADAAQKEAHDELKGRVGKLEDHMQHKADWVEVEKRLDRGAEKFDQVLLELKELNRNMSVLSAHIGVELAKRPTHEEVRALLQNGKP